MKRILFSAILFIGLTAALVQTQTHSKAIIGWKGSVRITESHHKEGKHSEFKDISVTDDSKMQLSCTFDPSINVDGTCSYSASGRTASSKGWLESTTDASSARANVSAGYGSGKVGIGISGFSAKYKLSTSIAPGGTEETNVGPFSYEAPANSPSGSWSDGNGRTITWNLTPIYGKEVATETESEDKPEPVEAAFKAVDYDDWTPSAGENEEQPGNTLIIKARVFKKDNPSEQSPKKARFKFTLIDVSKEKGVCMNWPQPKDQKGGYDLKIDPAENTDLDVAKDGLSAISKELSYDASVTVTSYDWGGWGTVMVTAYPEDSGTVSAHLESNKSKYDLAIPKDENNNHVADSWEESNEAGMADADDDMLPAGDGHQGDGFPTYEEYRGFRAKGVHIQTDPFQKDLFIWDPSNLGLGYFDQSGLTTHLVSAYEWDFQAGATNPRVINFNRGNAAIGAQHLLYLKNENMPGLFGLADGTGPGTPKTCHTVKIDVARCRATDEQQFKGTTAHELAHASGVWHHGDLNYEISMWAELQPNGTWAPFHYLDGSNAQVAAQDGQESGVEKCIMRYTGRTFFENPAGPVRWSKPGGGVQRGEVYGPPEAKGTFFCNTAQGDGINAPAGYHGVSKAGNATKGDCKHQFCVNDMRH